MTPPLSWLGIVRLGLVQTALGAIVVLTTSTLNRVMVVELALPALVPGLLVALHHLVQMLRPRWGYGSDRAARRTPWIIGGMVVLAGGGLLAAVSTAIMAQSLAVGLGLSVLAFTLIGIGVGASGTNLLVLLAERVAPQRRAAAATIVWVMMIAGFVVTGGLAGAALDPFGMPRLVAVTAAVSIIALVVAVLAVRGIEPDAPAAPRTAKPRASFAATLARVWADREARDFTLFVLLSMLAYSMQDLILEPFAGLVFGMSPGETTRLAGLQNAGTLAGMVGVGLVGGIWRETANGVLRRWIVVGCLGSAAALVAIAAGGAVGPGWPIHACVFGLGLANGCFAVAAIASMMGLAGRHGEADRGTRMGLWGAAQAIGFGLGGFVGALASDVAGRFVATPSSSYGLVFVVEAMVFLVCAAAATRLGSERGPSAVALEPIGR